MAHIYGDVADTAPEGFLPRRVHFSTLARLDEPTAEGVLTRVIQASGFGTRALPLPIDGLGYGRGHEDTVPVGRLDKVVVEGSNAEGWGWLVDNEDGRKAYDDLRLNVQNGNSIVMADVKVAVDFEFSEKDDLSVTMTFTQANIARTSLVMSPAFASARADLEDIAASLAVEGDLEVTAAFEAVWPGHDELTAGILTMLPHDAFTVPEPDVYTTFHVTDDGKRVMGHLGRFGEPHTGFIDRRVVIPHSNTNYASFCKTPRKTDGGRVYTGPLILLGGHDATSEAINKSLADVKNAWADVVVVDGKIGPWVCGVVRPGISDFALHAGAGSRISGHWLRGELYAICSVNAEGFDVPRATKYVVEEDADGEVEYLAASFGVEGKPLQQSQFLAMNPGIISTTSGSSTWTLSVPEENMAEVAQFTAFGPHSTATVKGTWDAGAQEKNVVSPNTLGYYGRIYAWQKPGAKATDGKYAKTDMGFPHHMVGSDGTPGAANLTGCSAGIGRLNQGNGGPDRQGIYNHLASHLRSGGQEPPKLLSMDEVRENQLAAINALLEEEDADAEKD